MTKGAKVDTQPRFDPLANDYTDECTQSLFEQLEDEKALKWGGLIFWAPLKRWLIYILKTKKIYNCFLWGLA